MDVEETADGVSHEAILAKKRAELLERKASLENYLARLRNALEEERRSGKAKREAEYNAAQVPEPKETTQRLRGRSQRRKGDVDYVTPTAPPASGIYTRDQQSVSGSDDPVTALKRSMALCKRIVNDLLKLKFANIFAAPVDWKALNIPDYPNIIKNPMDLGTVMAKLDEGKYDSVDSFVEDVQLIWNNAKTFNPPKTDVYIIASNFENAFRKKLNSVLREKKNSQKRAESYVSPVKATRRKSRPKAQFSDSDKEKLRRDLSNLSESELVPVVDIIGGTLGHEDAFEIDVEAYDVATLKKLRAYVRNIHQKKNASAAAQRKPSPATLPMPKMPPAFAPGYTDKSLYSSDDDSSSSDSGSASDMDRSTKRQKVTSPSEVSPIKDVPQSTPADAEKKEVHLENSDAWSSIATRVTPGSADAPAEEGSSSVWSDFQKRDAENRQRLKDQEELEAKKRAEEEQEKVRRHEEEERERQQRIQLEYTQKSNEATRIDESDAMAEFESLVHNS